MICSASSRCEPLRTEAPIRSAPSSTARLHDLLGAEPDAGVDHVEADVPRRHRDHLGAVRVAVEARLADHDPRPVADALAERARCARAALHAVAARGRASARRRRSRGGTRRTPGAGRRAHSPVVTRASAHSIDGSIMLLAARGRRLERVERGRDALRDRGCARVRSRLASVSRDRRGVDLEHARRRRRRAAARACRRSSLFMPTTTCSPVLIRAHPLRHRARPAPLHVAGLDRGAHAAHARGCVSISARAPPP